MRSDHGGGTGHRHPARTVGGATELHVRDEGPGVPPEVATRAFERFSRGDDARTRGGSGLGLAIVEAVAQAHGGTAGIAAVRHGSGRVDLDPGPSDAPERLSSPSHIAPPTVGARGVSCDGAAATRRRTGAAPRASCAGGPALASALGFAAFLGARGAARGRLRDEAPATPRRHRRPPPRPRYFDEQCRTASRSTIASAAPLPPPGRPDDMSPDLAVPARARRRTGSGRWGRTSTCSFPKRRTRDATRTPSRRCSRSGRTRSAGSGPEASSPGSTIGPGAPVGVGPILLAAVEASLAGGARDRRALRSDAPPRARPDRLRPLVRRHRGRRPGAAVAAEAAAAPGAGSSSTARPVYGHPACGQRARPRRDREGHGRRRLARPAPGASGPRRRS